MCGKHNFAKNILCYNCQNPKKKEDLIISEDWQCPCKFANHGDNTNCGSCGKLKDPYHKDFMYFKMPLGNHTFKKTDFMCRLCHTVNFYYHEYCRYCFSQEKLDVILVKE